MLVSYCYDGNKTVARIQSKQIFITRESKENEIILNHSIQLLMEKEHTVLFHKIFHLVLFIRFHVA